MKTYFIRHTEKLDIDENTFNHLLKNNLIAIHFPYLKHEKEPQDTTSINPDDYKKSHWKKSINTFVSLAENGGYVCSEYRSLSGALIGYIPPKSPINLYNGVWGGKNGLEGREAIIKTLSLKKAKLVPPEKYLIISTGRPRQGTVCQWQNVGKRIECLVENKPLEQILGNLSPTQQEVLCSEYIRLNLDNKNLPKVTSLLLPIGRTLIDVDIVGITNENKKIYVQVTYSLFKHCKSKFESLKNYKTNNTIAVFFCNCHKIETIDDIIVYPLELVFNKYKATENGAFWISENFK